MCTRELALQSAWSARVFFAGAESLGAGTGSRVGVADRVRRCLRRPRGPPLTRWPRAGQLRDEEDGSALCLRSGRVLAKAENGQQRLIDAPLLLWTHTTYKVA